MKMPLSWLKDYVDISMTAEELADRLTLAGMEVESITHIGELWDRDKLFVGQVLQVTRHPEADRLVLARVEYGGSAPLTVVTGAPNLFPFVGQDLSRGRGPKVAFAIAGARLVDGHSEELRIVRLKPSKIRGVASEGMVCSEKELDLSDEHEGIIVLPDDAPVGTPLADYMGDAVVDFEIKGPKGYLQSVTGIARETAALTGQVYRNPVADGGTVHGIHPATVPDAGFVGIVIQDPDLCPRYSAALIEGLTVKPSPAWMQQRLQRAGMRPINNIVDVTNYVMLELGQPLHAFDYDLLRARAAAPGNPTIIMRRARPGEHLTTLDGVDRALDPGMLMITDTAGAIAVGGIMGGADTEIHDGTTRVLLEAANFDFIGIRRTMQLLKLSSEAGARFGKQVDPELTVKALARAGQLLEELAGGAVQSVFGDVYPGKPESRHIELDPDYVNRLLGVETPVDEMVRILRALEFEVDGRGGPPCPPSLPAVGEDSVHERAEPAAACSPGNASPLLRVGVPSYRQDVTIPADLAEEIGRIQGWDRLPRTLLEDRLPLQRRNLALEGEEKVRDLLVGCGLDEVITYSIIDLAGEARLDAGGSTEGGHVGPPLQPHVRLLNPLAADRAHLRRTLLPGLLNTARANLRFLDRVAIFEVGRVFIPRADRERPAEPRRLAALMVGPREPATWQPHEAAPLGFFDLKGVLEELLGRLSLHDITWELGSHPALHPGRTARLTVGASSVELGYLGELHPVVRAAFDLPEAPVAVMELDLDALLAPWGAAEPMTDISTQPAVYEDVAVVVDEATPAAQVAALIRQAGGKLLVDLRLFDVYQGSSIAAGKKSLAYALTFQTPDRTLTDDDTAKIRARIAGRLERELGATLRR